MEYRDYKKFHNEELANDFIQLLQDHDIGFKVSRFKSVVDPLYSGHNPIDLDITVKIRKADFAKVDAILETISNSNLAMIDNDHYLFDFSDEELFDVITRPDEWSRLDYRLSIQILKSRGKELDDDLIKSLKNQRLRDLSKPESSQTPWIMIGYFLSFLGGLLGLFIGYHLVTNRKTLPDGQIVFGYNESDRKNGKIILVLGIVSLIIWTFILKFKLNTA